ncbi:hypothetical protein CEUSTIGMA_g9109.t1 [Chlamydomonas eustigma]|uniref:protein-serine/threonine phosphatase n=1 Tax=Chlamydomonas eustigma TaxID=1157962 RepID=A0A250XF40_9CHLO|nr:hypothetical protein CEUSTIGMA_g9109.t1 [Chlamydomonas eustigma]|eukprot:GAX81681.1 hypothetical protein CEUSTIGMA_g9109.t1 [Chlamydomonas eustigma]
MSSLHRAMTIDVSGLNCHFKSTTGESLTHSHSANDAMNTNLAGSFDHVIKALSKAPAEENVTSPSQNMPASAFSYPETEAVLKVVIDSAELDRGTCSGPATDLPASPTAFDTVALTASISTLASSLPTSFFTSCPFGVKAVIGKRSKMEDAFQVQTNLIDIPSSGTSMEDKFPARIALQLASNPSHGSSDDTIVSPSTPSNRFDFRTPEERRGQTLHFFGVYDGHGGDQAANHCAARLHQHLSDALSQLRLEGKASHQLHCSYWVGDGENQCKSHSVLGETESIQLDDSSLQVEQLTSAHDNVSGDGCFNRGYSPSKLIEDPIIEDTLVEDALRAAFQKTDEEFASDCCASMVGTTAVVALLGTKKIWVANCGDSRAIMCRAGKCLQLTDDHKPEREDEAARVEKAGGQVLYWNGHRVMGVLAMSRAIGDHGLRPYVISDPEISVVNRTEDDDFLILASDGLWDVMENQEATSLALRCMMRAWEKGAGRKAAARIAASVLTKAAIDRGSKDNVTVVIVDLRSGVGPTAAAATGHDAAITTIPELQPTSSSQDVVDGAPVRPSLTTRETLSQTPLVSNVSSSQEDSVPSIAFKIASTLSTAFSSSSHSSLSAFSKELPVECLREENDIASSALHVSDAPSLDIASDQGLFKVHERTAEQETIAKE